MSDPAAMTAAAAGLEPPPSMPRGIHNAYIFDFFNATSFTAILGTPMLLFFQHLQATATILALAAGLAPLLNILQIPAARHVERVGYRRFVLGGWTLRSFFILGMMLVALLPESIDRTTRIMVVLVLLFIFNAIRGLSVCGMLPWFTHIVPEERRGEFLSKDQLAVAAAAILSLAFYGIILMDLPAGYAFGIVFAISAAAAFVSLHFLKRIPDVPVEKIVINPHPMPWREMFFYPPFFNYIRYNVVTNIALGASNVFWVRYFRAFLHVSESRILFVACASNIVLAAALILITPSIDRTSNKQVLTLSGLLFAGNFAGWACVSAGLLPFNHLVLGIQIFSSGVGAALWNLANVRCVMGIVPVMGRPHFLALYSVASNLTLGLVPLAWGPILDALEHWHGAWGAWLWNSYSLLYCTLTATALLGLVMLRSIAEPQRMTWDLFMRELLVHTPSRAISRLVGRLRLPGIG